MMNFSCIAEKLKLIGFTGGRGAGGNSTQLERLNSQTENVAMKQPVTVFKVHDAKTKVNLLKI